LKAPGYLPIERNPQGQQRKAALNFSAAFFLSQSGQKSVKKTAPKTAPKGLKNDILYYADLQYQILTKFYQNSNQSLPKFDHGGV
jgi:hypothetical protein